MKCRWREVPDSMDASGKRRVLCIRVGCHHGDGGRHPLKPTNLPHDKINAECSGYPLHNEYREWLALFSAAAGITRALAICQYVRWRLRGSKIEELPPGVPHPNVLPNNYLLSDAEVKELFPDDDKTLIGNRIAALTEALGIPPCGRCEARRQWLNMAHARLRRGIS